MNEFDLREAERLYKDPLLAAIRRAETAAQNANQIAERLKELLNAGALNGKDAKPAKDGYTPIKGVDYFDGKDGHTPIKGVDYFDGRPGSDANVTRTKVVEEIGFEPAKDDDVGQVRESIVDLQKYKIDKPSNAPAVGKVLKIKSVNDDGSMVCEWADDEKGIALSDIPTGNNTTNGLFRSGGSQYGISADNGMLYAYAARDNAVIDAKAQGYQPIVPQKIDRAVRAGLISNAEIEDADKPLICNTIGAEPNKGEWVLKGTLTKENVDTGVNVDLTGCTELIIKGYSVGTGSSNLNHKPGNNAIVNSVISNGSRTLIAHAIDLFNGYKFDYAKYISVANGKYVSSSLSTYDFFDESVSKITNFYINTPAVVTECNIEIYAR